MRNRCGLPDGYTRFVPSLGSDDGLMCLLNHFGWKNTVHAFAGSAILLNEAHETGSFLETKTRQGREGGRGGVRRAELLRMLGAAIDCLVRRWLRWMCSKSFCRFLHIYFFSRVS